MRATQATSALAIEERVRANLAPMRRTQLGGPHSRAMTWNWISQFENNLLLEAVCIQRGQARVDVVDHRPKPGDQLRIAVADRLDENGQLRLQPVARRDQLRTGRRRIVGHVALQDPDPTLAQKPGYPGNIEASHGLRRSYYELPSSVPKRRLQGLRPCSLRMAGRICAQAIAPHLQPERTVEPVPKRRGR